MTKIASCLGLNTGRCADGKHTVVIETGIGNKHAQMRAIHENQEQLPASLASAGVRPEEVDIVINTHLHFDHCGGYDAAPGCSATPTFPNAPLLRAWGRGRHGHLQLDRDRVSYLSQNYDPLVESGQMTLLDDEQTKGRRGDLRWGSVELFPGHTDTYWPCISSRRGNMRATRATLLPTSAHLDATWVMGYDLIRWSASRSGSGSMSGRFRRSGWCCLPRHHVPWLGLSWMRRENRCAVGGDRA